MTEAGWTREKPSKEGVYWFRWTENSNPLILSVAKDDCDWRVLEMGNQYDGALAGYSGGEFLGPITPDSYQRGRVAGLWEAVNIAREWPWSRGPAHTNPLHVAKRKGERDASGCIADNIESLIGHPGQAQEGVGG